MLYTIESIQAQEEACVLPSFDSNVAWDIGTIIRTRCQQTQTRPAVIYIAHANSSQLLFFATTGAGTMPDNMYWVKRKEAVVLRWGVSTLRMRARLREEYGAVLPLQDILKDKFEVSDPSVYACHGGGFPVRIKNAEGVVGVIVVSGLTQEDDHAVIVDSVKEYLSK